MNFKLNFDGVVTDYILLCAYLFFMVACIPMAISFIVWEWSMMAFRAFILTGALVLVAAYFNRKAPQ